MTLPGSLNIIILAAAVWLFMATPSIAQSQNAFVIDTRGEPVDFDDEYFIRPAISGNGGGFNLINRDGSCPFHVGLENTDLSQGLQVKFIPFGARHEDDDDVRVNSDLRVAFDGSTSCAQSTEWRLDQNDTRSGRRLIITGRDDGAGSYGNFFRIVPTQNARVYNIQWCPRDVCPTCNFRCGTAGILRENGKILLALDGDALPVVFQKE